MMLILMLIMMLKFCVRESSNLIGLENFVVAGFSITARLGWCSSHHLKSDQISSHQSPPSPNFCIHQIFTLLREVGD